jgi:DNA-binding phage protein
MKSVKVPTTVRFRDYLIDSLQDPEAAAAYLSAILDEEDLSLSLLKGALLDVVEASTRTTLSSKQAELHQQKLDVVLSYPTSLGIHELAGWLKELGLKLTVTVEDDHSVPEE